MMIAASAFAVAVAAPVAAKSDKPTKKEDRLVAAGFVDRPATSPAMQAMLTRLPQNKFLRRTNGGNVSYVYADAKKCDCLYVGSQQAYGAYQQDKQARHIADENAMAASDYQDASWDWGPWGPGSFGPGFGWGPGLGW